MFSNTYNYRAIIYQNAGIHLHNNESIAHDLQKIVIFHLHKKKLELFKNQIYYVFFENTKKKRYFQKIALKMSLLLRPRTLVFQTLNLLQFAVNKLGIFMLDSCRSIFERCHF